MEKALCVDKTGLVPYWVDRTVDNKTTFIDFRSFDGSEPDASKFTLPRICLPH